MSARGLLRAAIPFAGYTTLTTLYLRVDVVLLSLLAGAHELGLYQPPVRILTALIILPDALASILLSRASRSPDAAEVRRRQEQVLALGIPIGIVLVALSAVAGGRFLALLYGSELGMGWSCRSKSTSAFAIIVTTCSSALREDLFSGSAERCRCTSS